MLDRLRNITKKLHPLEREILPHVIDGITAEQLQAKAHKQEVEVTRVLQWLENKGAVSIATHKQNNITLGTEGKKYLHDGLPEKQVLKALENSKKQLSELIKITNLSSQEINASIGRLKKYNAITTEKEKELIIVITEKGKQLLNNELPEERLLKKIAKEGVTEETVTKEEKEIYNELKKRKGILKTVQEITKTITLTKIGQRLAKIKADPHGIEAVTPELLKSGEWRNKKFREYDVEINVPKIKTGKTHPVNDAIAYIKKIWLEMGFTEMKTTHVQTAFWDLDALFVPQDHPAREMQDTFYVGTKQKVLDGKLPKQAKRVRDVHESGGNTGSIGWQQEWHESIAKQVLLRTHTTVTSAKVLAELKKEDIPAKFFCIGKVYRNEALDWKHLCEFYQVEGIVVDPNANFQHLIGYLKLFYKKMGFSKIRIRPFFFPYTAFSCEVEVFNEKRNQWIELGGAGIFRPEVVEPLLGFPCPVLAWGQGMERIIMEYYKLTDLRDLYKNDLKQIQSMKEWVML